jgi:hypothetical protein
MVKTLRVIPLPHPVIGLLFRIPGIGRCWHEGRSGERKSVEQQCPYNGNGSDCQQEPD